MVSTNVKIPICKQIIGTYQRALLLVSSLIAHLVYDLRCDLPDFSINQPEPEKAMQYSSVCTL